MASQPSLGTDEEIRIAWDGWPYTGLQFIEHYSENSEARWEEASMATAEPG